MKTIPLTQGQVAIVDDEDFERVLQHKWHAIRHKDLWYAGTVINGKNIHMHKLITGFSMTDHVNRDGLDNRRSNLRECNHSENGMNRKSNRNHKYAKGCTFRKEVKYAKNPWQSQIKINGETKYLGVFSSEEQAAHAYDVAARKYFGKFSCTNDKHER